MTIKTGEHLDFIPPHEERPGPGYERSDLSMRAVGRFAIGFGVFITVAHLIMIAMFFAMERDEKPPITPFSPPAVHVEAPIVGPQLEVSPSLNWGEMNAAQQRLLHGPPAWVDPQAGIVRIPIDRAMGLALLRGFPTRETSTRAADETSETFDVRSEK